MSLVEKKIWKILYEILPLLKFIHQEQVIHRDIKLENILGINGANLQEVGKSQKYQLVLVLMVRRSLVEVQINN